MLSDQQIADEVRRMSYKPGWKLSVFHNDPVQGLYLGIDTKVPNSYRPDEVVPLYINSIIPPMFALEDLRIWVLWRLKAVEVHEAMEWFKVDGVVFDDPHQPIRSTLGNPL